MAKIFYVVEKAGDYISAHFFKTEKEALTYGIAEFPDFDMFDEPMEDDENEVWLHGDSIDFKKGILFSFEEGESHVQSMDEDEAREYSDDLGGDGATIFFDKFTKGMYGYLGNGADGKGRKWDWDGMRFNESLVTEGKEADEAEAILNDLLDERGGDMGELHGMEMEDALDTVEAYGHKGSKAKKIAQELHSLCNESLVTEKFNFSKKEVEAAATLIASAISQADKVKAKVHDLEYDKGRGAGFEISIDGEKYAGGSYVVKDNGDVVNAAIGNSHPNAVYNTIGNKDIADVFINMEKYESNSVTEANGQTVKEFADLLALLLDEDSGMDIERAILAMDPKKARVLEKQISTLSKKLFDLTNQGFGLREDNALTVESAAIEAEEVTTTRKTVLMFEEFVLEGDCKCGGNCTCTTTTTNEANADGTISDDEDDDMENFFADIEFQVDELCTYIKRETEKIGGPFRSPGYEAQGIKLVKATFKKHKIKI